MPDCHQPSSRCHGVFVDLFMSGLLHLKTSMLDPHVWLQGATFYNLQFATCSAQTAANKFAFTLYATQA